LGRIFSIEEFSTYDGRGIRCTVFLKGCPLRCQWCHNPEGQRSECEIMRSFGSCLGCGACLEAGRLAVGVPSLTAESIGVCPRRLIRVCGEDITAAELVAKLDKNIAILNLSGGGITFSGGEPLMQSDFLLEALTLLRGKTSRALQTCGYCEGELFARVLSECDLVLYDLKLIDPELHRRYTGVSNELILENYRSLVRSGVEFVTRIPLIPSVNDTEENITATASFMNELGVRYVELLPYNKMAGGKYPSLGRSYRVDFPCEAEPSPRLEIFKKYGIEVKIL